MNETVADMPASQGDRDDEGPSAEPGEPAEPEPPRRVSGTLADGAVEVCGESVSDADRLWIRDRLRDAIPLVVERFGRDVQSLSVEVIDDHRMVDLQARFHPPAEGAATSTDVLTFDLGSQDGPVVAEIAICADEATRRAIELGHPARRELLLYALHGLLHCMGLDDHDPSDYDAMHAEEDRILEAMGIGATFRSAGGTEEAT